jgi:hypothetical protein
MGTYMQLPEYFQLMVFTDLLTAVRPGQKFILPAQMNTELKLPVHLLTLIKYMHW